MRSRVFGLLAVIMLVQPMQTAAQTANPDLRTRSLVTVAGFHDVHGPRSGYIGLRWTR